MILTGVSFKMKDKRVDKMLSATGMSGADIYYAPIGCWALVVMLYLGMIGGLLVSILINSPGSQLLIVLCVCLFYLLISYLINAPRHNTIALYEDKLIAVNPNPPFRKITVFNNSEIRKIIFDQQHSRWLGCFAALSDNYLLIETGDQSIKIHCAGLETDSYDEDWTEKVLEDLNAALLKKGIHTEIRLID
jgi:hypothetical protein